MPESCKAFALGLVSELWYAKRYIGDTVNLTPLTAQSNLSRLIKPARLYQRSSSFTFFFGIKEAVNIIKEYSDSITFTFYYTCLKAYI